MLNYQPLISPGTFYFLSSMVTVLVITSSLMSLDANYTNGPKLVSPAWISSLNSRLINPIDKLTLPLRCQIGIKFDMYKAVSTHILHLL